MEFLSTLEQSALAIWVAESLWGYPLVLTLHAIGMAFVVGILLIFYLRILGFAPEVSVIALQKMMTIAVWAFVVNLLSGSALFIADASRFFFQIAFQIKFFLIVLGLVLTAVFKKTMLANAADWPGGVAPVNARIFAVVSLLIWISAITAGRLIAYL